MTMEQYTIVSYTLAEHLTKYYSSSFSMSSRLFAKPLRRHIYAIYGLVRTADEIVDTYRGEAAATELAELEAAVTNGMATGYSTNPIVHAFVQTARTYEIDKSLIAPFFDSMRRDLTAVAFSRKEYEQYIYGSAEVVGLMCLRVFVNGDEHRYADLAPGAKALGAAYQKVNFLRDIAHDAKELGRNYFPNVIDGKLSESNKTALINEISADFAVAKQYIDQLPSTAKRAVRMSYVLYSKLLLTVARTPAAVLRKKRVRISDLMKFYLFLRGYISR